MPVLCTSKLSKQIQIKSNTENLDAYSYTQIHGLFPSDSKRVAQPANETIIAKHSTSGMDSWRNVRTLKNYQHSGTWSSEKIASSYHSLFLDTFFIKLKENPIERKCQMQKCSKTVHNMGNGTIRKGFYSIEANNQLHNHKDPSEFPGGDDIWSFEIFQQYKAFQNFFFNPSILLEVMVFVIIMQNLLEIRPNCLESDCIWGLLFVPSWPQADDTPPLLHLKAWSGIHQRGQ